MKVDGKQLCLACGSNVATKMDGTVPLCDSCSSQVTNPRGVKFEKPRDHQHRKAAAREDAMGLEEQVNVRLVHGQG